MALSANWLDWLVLGIYFVGVFAFGLYMSRREGAATDFFLAGRRLPWYAIALSLFATNISSGSLVGMAGQGYTIGMGAGTLQWHAIFTLILLAFVYLPYYQRRSVTTIPEFLELRYGLSTRTLFALAVILFDMIVTLPYVFYSAGLVIEVIFGVPMEWPIVAIALLVAVYTAWGGLTAVVWTDSLQAIFMLAGGVIATLFGLQAIGGLDALMAQAADKMHVVLPADHPDYPFPASMFGGYLLVSVYYWCHGQFIVQRVLGARAEWDARMGTILTCYIKLFLPFITVLPGVIAFVLFPELNRPDKALPMLVGAVVPAGLSGVIIAALLAAFMSSASSIANSWATVLANDVYHRLIDRKATAKRLILVGRIATVFLFTVAVIRTPGLRENQSIMQFFQTGLAYISTPVIVIFAMGIFWRRATAAASVAAIVASPLICYFAQHMRQLTGFGPSQPSIVYWSPIAVAMTILLMMAVSRFTKPKPAAALEGLMWSGKDTLAFSVQLFQRRDIEGAEPAAMPSSRPGIWTDYRLATIVVLILLAAIMWFVR